MARQGAGRRCARAAHRDGQHRRRRRHAQRPGGDAARHRLRGLRRPLRRRPAQRQGPGHLGAARRRTHLVLARARPADPHGRTRGPAGRRGHPPGLPRPLAPLPGRRLHRQGQRPAGRARGVRARAPRSRGPGGRAPRADPRQPRRLPAACRGGRVLPGPPGAVAPAAALHPRGRRLVPHFAVAMTHPRGGGARRTPPSAG
ncbi:hypothetical protein SBRY_140127 [Actinacidiphila bryophytorum]|uniref:Uncharacterized protein n=1 Tax=Actinacidiphila bryophytorum TaxID=1436133 RepID=A0A9W4GZ47_9ACTN|nr:hypothetical protein SBRY_140127 [Actinacidiphila bryophytorum]